MRATCSPLALLGGSVLCWVISSGASAPHLQYGGAGKLRPPRWERLPTGVVRPRGWLLAQAKLQAAALTSHLPLFWPEVANTSWLGGPADNVGGVHQSTPYWLNGATPLALQLDDPVLTALVERYISGILDRQRSDGWLGPDTDPLDYWSRYPLILALAQYHEARPNSTLGGRALSAALRFFDAVGDRLANGTKLVSWSSARTHDLIWAIHYFADVPGTPPDMIAKSLTLAARLHYEGMDWHDAWFNNSTNFPRHAIVKPSDWTHGVNNAQAVKHGSIWARQSGDLATGFSKSWHAWKMLMRYHGQPSGIFAADEHLAGRMPSRGAELCMVVESMWSLALMAQIAPTDENATKALDALEKLAFNALPGSLSDDMWSHPYLQFANSFQASPNTSDAVWAQDGPDAAMYGLQPNYECCLSNFHQGYPKLVAHLFFIVPDEDALVSAVWAPSAVHVPRIGGGLDVELQTQYPFGTSVEYIVRNPEAFKLRIRLPAFLREVAGPSQGLATVRVWREGHEQLVELVDGFLEYEIPPWPLPEPRVAIRIEWAVGPKLQRSDSLEQGASIFVGPLLMALDLGEMRHAVRHYEFASADWNTTASRSWRYALRATETHSFGPLSFRLPGTRPFRHSADACPLAFNATLTLLSAEAWPERHHAPGPLPHSAPGDADEQRLLLPYACTAIRISAFPEATTFEQISI